MSRQGSDPTHRGVAQVVLQTSPARRSSDRHSENVDVAVEVDSVVEMVVELVAVVVAVVVEENVLVWVDVMFSAQMLQVMSQACGEAQRVSFVQ